MLNFGSNPISILTHSVVSPHSSAVVPYHSTAYRDSYPSGILSVDSSVFRIAEKKKVVVSTDSAAASYPHSFYANRDVFDSSFWAESVVVDLVEILWFSVSVAADSFPVSYPEQPVSLEISELESPLA